MRFEGRPEGYLVLRQSRFAYHLEAVMQEIHPEQEPEDTAPNGDPETPPKPDDAGAEGGNQRIGGS